MSLPRHGRGVVLMWEYYINNIRNRDQALMVLAGLVLSGMLWWHLLEGRPRLRRALSWGGVVLYFTLMLVSMRM